MCARHPEIQTLPKNLNIAPKVGRLVSVRGHESFGETTTQSIPEMAQDKVLEVAFSQSSRTPVMSSQVRSLEWHFSNLGDLGQKKRGRSKGGSKLLFMVTGSA